MAHTNDGRPSLAPDGQAEVKYRHHGTPIREDPCNL